MTRNYFVCDNTVMDTNVRQLCSIFTANNSVALLKHQTVTT